MEETLRTSQGSWWGKNPESPLLANILPSLSVSLEPLGENHSEVEPSILGYPARPGSLLTAPALCTGL